MGIKSYNMKHVTYNIRKFKHFTRAFTFIEMLVVIGVIALTLPVLFAIIFAILQQQMKVYRLSEVKRQGDYVMNMVITKLKSKPLQIRSDPNNIDPSFDRCNTAGSSSTESMFFVEKRPTDWFRFSRQNDAGVTHGVFYTSTVNNSIEYDDFITTRNVYIVPFYGELTMCIKPTTFSPPLVFIGFKITHLPVSTRPEENVSLDYRAVVQLKSY